MTTRRYKINVLGRTLEHLGVQMYKRRDTAIAELVANSWDAGAGTVWIDLPESSYDPSVDKISIEDNGTGMTPDQVQDDYLVVGRNRRTAGGAATSRAVMGRKGIGKLAGFGIARSMGVETWRDGQCTTFALQSSALKTDAGEVSEVPVEGVIGDPPADARSASGTRLVLSGLKHSTPLDVARLREALGRRFSRTVRGQMSVFVNGEEIEEPLVDWEGDEPTEISETLKDGNKVKYLAGFSTTTLGKEMRGFTVMVAGKTAQAPPYFFDVEAKASGQHGTRYLHGWIEADFLDAGVDDDSDLVSTDRQEIDWETKEAEALHAWGDALTRKLLRDWANRRSERTQKKVYDNPELKARIDRLDAVSKQQVENFIGKLGLSQANEERLLDLASALIRAYEYKHFHDVTEEIASASDDPDRLDELLAHLVDWKVLESRAVLEIVHGRLQIVDTFASMVVGDSPETASKVNPDNLHDLIARYPWLLDPEWQTFEEERSTTKQLREWAFDGKAPDATRRFDFLALEGPDELLVIEIKRSGHAVDLEERQRVEMYVRDLQRSGKRVRGVMVSGGNYNFNAHEQSSSIELLTWAELVTRARRFYEHYRDVVEGEINSSSFDAKSREVKNTRSVLETGVKRAASERSIGEQDVDWAKET